MLRAPSLTAHLPLPTLPLRRFLDQSGPTAATHMNLQADLYERIGWYLYVRTGERLYECLMCMVETCAILFTTMLGSSASSLGRLHYVCLQTGWG